MSKQKQTKQQKREPPTTTKTKNQVYGIKLSFLSYFCPTPSSIYISF